MGLLDEILEKHNLKFEELTPIEREYLLNKVSSIESGKLTLEGLKDAIHAMKDSVEQALANEPEYVTLLFFKVRNDKNIHLKARLKNYMLLENLLERPERTKRQLEQELNNIKTDADLT